MSNTTQIMKPAQPASTPGEIMERVIAAGDLSRLQPADRVLYYAEVCQSVGLNPLTKPFEYINLNGKLTLYALKGATDQLRSIYGVTISISNRETIDGVYSVTARAKNRDGREDEDCGAVSIVGLKGDLLANAIMKATTKAKRRVTLSICGLGMLDETEVETIPGARVQPMNDDEPPTAGTVATLPPKQPAPAADAADPLADDKAFVAAMGKACIERGATRESAWAWWVQGLTDNNKTTDDFSLEMRHEFIAQIKAGKYDAALKPRAEPATPAAESFRAQFVKLAGEMEIDEDGANQAFDKWLMRAGFRKDENKVPPAKRAAVLAAMREDRFDYARGAIAETAMAG